MLGGLPKCTYCCKSCSTGSEPTFSCNETYGWCVRPEPCTPGHPNTALPQSPEAFIEGQALPVIQKRDYTCLYFIAPRLLRCPICCSSLSRLQLVQNAAFYALAFNVVSMFYLFVRFPFFVLSLC